MPHHLNGGAVPADELVCEGCGRAVIGTRLSPLALTATAFVAAVALGVLLYAWKH